MTRGFHPGTVAIPRRAWALATLAFLCVSPALRSDDRTSDSPARPRDAAVPVARQEVRPNQPAGAEPEDASPLAGFDRTAAARSLQTVAIFGLISLAPLALLMLTGFIRINIALTLLRQAIGSPQVPGNQVITALSLLLTTLVMWPSGEAVYRDAVAPYAAGKLPLGAAWESGLRPIKAYMLGQLERTRHEGYLEALYEYAATGSPGQGESPPRRPEDYPFRVIAPAFVLSEVTTGILIGFYIYLPFLVVDLVVSAILAATGLFMLPPTLVAFPVKLILFHLADGWILVPTMLLASFGAAGG